MAYALIALGFVLALNASGAVNFAHGDLVVLGGATAVSFGLWTELPAPLLLPFVALVLGVAGVIASRVAILPLVQRPPEATFVATIALAAVIEQALTVTMGAAARTSPSLIGGGRILAAGGAPVVIPEKNLTADVDAILAAVTPRTKIVFIANPNNPTGTYLPVSEVKRLHAGLLVAVVPDR